MPGPGEGDEVEGREGGAGGEGEAAAGGGGEGGRGRRSEEDDGSVIEEKKPLALSFPPLFSPSFFPFICKHERKRKAVITSHQQQKLVE